MPRGHSHARASHHFTHHSPISHHHTPISSHHYHSSGGGGRVKTLRILSPAEVAYRNQITEMESKIEPSPHTKFLFRSAGFLQFVTFPLLLATIGNPWYIIEADSSTRWDGSSDSSHTVQAGKLLLFEYHDCVSRWSDYVDWYFCNLYSESIAESDADPTLKTVSDVCLAFTVICILSNVALNIRHFWTCGNRLLRKGDEWYIRWTKITRFQLIFHAVLLLIANAAYRQNIPEIIDTTIGSGAHRFGPGIQLALAAMIISFISASIYSRYLVLINAHAASTTLPELPPTPPPMTQQEAALAWAQQYGQQYAVGMMTAQQQMAMNNGATTGIPIIPNGTVPMENGVPNVMNPNMPPNGMGIPPNMMVPPGGFIPGMMGGFPPGMMMQPGNMMMFPQPGMMMPPQPGMMMMPPQQSMQPNMYNPGANDMNDNAPKNAFMYNNNYANTIPQQSSSQPTMSMRAPVYPYYQNPNNMNAPPVTVPFIGTGYPTGNTVNNFGPGRYPSGNNTDEPSAEVDMDNTSTRDLNSMNNSSAPGTETTTQYLHINSNTVENSSSSNDNPSDVTSPSAPDM